MWNNKTLTPPPVCEFKVEINAEHRANLKKAHGLLKTGYYDVWSDHDKLIKTEQYVMGRTVYKLRNQFRSEKSLCGLRQVLSNLKKIQNFSVPATILKLAEMVKIPVHEDEAYLPSRQTLQYELVRLQGLAALLTRVVNLSIYTFRHIKEHIDIGMMIPQNIVMLAGTARIWYVCGSLRDYVCEWYTKLLSCLNIFKPTGIDWLHDDLPVDLKCWLREIFDSEPSTENDSVLMESMKEEVKGMVVGDSDARDELTLVPASIIEDLGEPVSRKRPMPAKTKEIDKTNKKKKKQKLLKDNTAQISTCSEPGVDSKCVVEETAVCKNEGKSPKYVKEKKSRNKHSPKELNKANKGNLSLKLSKDLHAERTVTEEHDQVSINVETVPSNHESRLKKMKQDLKVSIASLSDVDVFQNQIKSKKISLGKQTVILSNIGKKKILKKIAMVTGKVVDKGCHGDEEQAVLRKVRLPLSRMLLKYCEPSSEQRLDQVKSTNHSRSSAALSREEIVHKKVSDNINLEMTHNLEKMEQSVGDFTMSENMNEIAESGDKGKAFSQAKLNQTTVDNVEKNRKKKKARKGNKQKPNTKSVTHDIKLAVQKPNVAVASKGKLKKKRKKRK